MLKISSLYLDVAADTGVSYNANDGSSVHDAKLFM